MKLFSSCHLHALVPDPVRTPRAQQGVALFVALMILVIISVLGVAAMRSSITNARISTNVQGSTMSFQAAQSAINATMGELSYTGGAASDLLDSMLQSRSSGLVTIQTRCVVNGANVNGACSTGQFIGTRGLTQGSTRSILERDQVPMLRSNTMALNAIVVAATGSVPSLGMSNVNVQELGLVGPKINEVDSTDWN